MLTHRRYSTKFSFFSLSIRNKNETSIYDFLTSQKVETTDKSRYFTWLWLCFIRNDPSCVEHVKISFNPKIAWVRFSMFLFLAIIYCLVILKLTTTTTTKRSLSSVHLPPSLPPQSHHSLGLHISTILLFKLAFGFGDKIKKGCVVPFKSIDFSIPIYAAFILIETNINLLGKMAAKKLISPLARSLLCNGRTALLSINAFWCSPQRAVSRHWDKSKCVSSEASKPDWDWELHRDPCHPLIYKQQTWGAKAPSHMLKAW